MARGAGWDGHDLMVSGLLGFGPCVCCCAPRYVAGQKLPPLRTQVLQGLQQEDSSETDEVRMLNKYIVTPEKSRDEKWMGGTLALAEAMIAGHHGHHVMFIGDVFEQW